ncbi:MAG: ABC transporter permease subunit [Dehalococcoidales bacterium]|jgi:ABC-type phosphate transport system permease subunit
MTDTIKAAPIPGKTNYFSIFTWAITLIMVAAIILGALVLAFNSFDICSAPLLFTTGALLIIIFLFIKKSLKINQYVLIALAAAAIISGVISNSLPVYLQGLNIHGIIHRSVVSGLLILGISVPGACYSLYYALRGTPRAFDISRYPLLIFFILSALAAYAMIIVHIIQGGTFQLHWSLFTSAFQSQSHIIETWENGWPSFTTVPVRQTGMLNHITGTLMLMLLTSLISLPVGVSVGVIVHEYAGRKLSGIINFSTNALRSISGIILAVTAINLVRLPKLGSFWYGVFRGYGYDVNGMIQYGRSSFLFASVFISLLVIPIIAKATKEGLSSLPADIHEGSLALGVSKDHTLFHIQLPWSLPNIVTGLMLGCAEAAGALTIIFLLSGVGQYGVNPLNETTSLAYLIFDSKYWQSLGDTLGDLKNYQFTAALVLLIITIGFTTMALILKRNLAKRYKGA